jgi:hypothetical protein
MIAPIGETGRATGLADGGTIGSSRLPMAHIPCGVRVGTCQEGPVNTFIVDLKHRPGELAKVTETIAQKGIDITAFAGVTCGDSGEVAVITNDEAGTRRALSDAGYHVREIELASVSLPNRPGSLAETARKLANAGINIEAALPTGMAGGNVTVAFATDQPAKAKNLLSERVEAGVR